MKIDLKILPIDLLEHYQTKFDDIVPIRFDALHENDLSLENFNFYTSISAVYSSKIEGEEMEMDSFIKHKRFGVKYLPDFTKKIDDLYDAYLFAQQSKLNIDAALEAHALITRNILQPSQQGKIRSGNMYVLTNDGRIEYVAASPHKVKTDWNNLFDDIETLLRLKMSFSSAFFFASLIHLVFVKIHPFDDGNGRMGRLLEKWFLAQKLGSKTWYLQSEKCYYDSHSSYYKNIRLLGLEYDELDYTKAMPFLLMLPQSLMIENE